MIREYKVEDKEIKGFALIEPRNKVTKFYNIDIYVKPDCRKNGFHFMK